MTKEIEATDDELMSMMAELEAQNDLVMKPAVEEVESKATPVVTAPTSEPAAVVDMTRAILIHSAALKTVRRGTVGDIAPDEQEVERDEGIILAKAYKAEKEAAPKALLPWEDEPATAPVAAAPSTTPDFVKKLVKPKPEPVVFDDVPDLDAIAAAKASKKKERLEMEKLMDAADKEVMVVPVAVATVKPVVAAVVIVPDFEIPSGELPATSAIKDFTDKPQFDKDIRISEESLDKCITEHSALRAFYSAQAARAEHQAARMKAKFELIDAALYVQHRKALNDSGDKITEKMVESSVKTDPRWLASRNLVIDAEFFAAVAKGNAESFRDRKDMLVQLSVDRREEGKGAMRVLVEQQDRHDLRERALNGARHAA